MIAHSDGRAAVHSGARERHERIRSDRHVAVDTVRDQRRADLGEEAAAIRRVTVLAPLGEKGDLAGFGHVRIVAIDAGQRLTFLETARSPKPRVLIAMNASLHPFRIEIQLEVGAQRLAGTV
jgi:hypothetical protein